MGANSGTTKAGSDAKLALVAAQKTKLALVITQITNTEVGRGLPDTSVMQGTTREFVPDRVLLSD